MRRWVFLTISLVLVAFVVGLEVILKVSVDENGFGPVQLKYVYLWTYGPTAGT